MEQLPQDPYILLSFINTRLRDQYPDLETLCREMDVDRDELEKKLGAAGFEYLPAANQFR